MNEEPFEKTGRVMFIMSWLFLFFLGLAFFHFYEKSKEPKIAIKPGEISIEADQQGHYVIKGSINGINATFLLDTGATWVGIPENLAKKMGVSGRYPVTVDTAGGTVTGYLTRVNEISFGPFTLTDQKAVIIPGNQDQVMMGMNVLNQFHLIQKDKLLIIKSNEASE